MSCFLGDIRQVLSLFWRLKRYHLQRDRVRDGAGFQTFQTLDTFRVAAVGVDIFNIHWTFDITTAAIDTGMLVQSQA